MFYSVHDRLACPNCGLDTDSEFEHSSSGLADCLGDPCVGLYEDFEPPTLLQLQPFLVLRVIPVAAMFC